MLTKTWFRKPLKPLWSFVDWWGKHQRAWWLGLAAFMAVWMAYDLGRVITRAGLIGMGGQVQGVLSVSQLLEKATATEGGRLVITSDNSARFIDREGASWEVANFGSDINQASLDGLRDANVSMEGSAAIDIRPAKVRSDDLLASAFFDIATKLAFVGIYVLIIYLVLRALNSSGKRFRRIDGDKRPKLGIKDVAGHAGAKREVMEVVEYLRDPSSFDRVGARPPGGVLLHGPPGTGKTLLAKAIAGEANAAFLAQSASAFVQIYAGAGAQAVRKLFAEARKIRPCVIFIDEIDAVGASRSAMAHQEHIQCLNALLEEMDGFDDNTGIVVVAATNRLGVLDEGLLRPGRFDRKVHVPLPGRDDRLEIITVHAQRLPHLAANLSHWADQTKGFSGADLANLVNEAAVEAARANRNEVGDAEFAAARDRVLMGARDHGRTPSERDRQFVAYHEAGHALMRMVAGGRVEKVSILPRGGALGMTVAVDDIERLLVTQDEVREQLLVLMGGRAAEQVMFNTVTGGAADDMERASHLAREAIHRYGFDALGPYIPKHDSMLRDIELRAAAWVKQAYEVAVQTVSNHRAQVSALATDLLERDEVDEQDIRRHLSGLSQVSLPPLPKPAVSRSETSQG